MDGEFAFGVALVTGGRPHSLLAQVTDTTSDRALKLIDVDLSQVTGRTGLVLVITRESSTGWNCAAWVDARIER